MKLCSALLLAAILCAPVCAEAPGPLTIKVSLGLRDRPNTGHWNAAYFEVRNPGPALTATLSVEVRTRSYLQCESVLAGSYRLPLSLPPGASRHPLPLFLPAYLDTVTARLLGPGERLLAEKNQHVQAGRWRELALVVTHRQAELSAVRDAVSQVVYLTPGEVPQEARVLHALDYIILDDVRLEELSAGARLGLKRQAASGAILVLTGAFLQLNAASAEVPALTGATCGRATVAVPPEAVIAGIRRDRPWRARSARLLPCTLSSEGALAAASGYPLVFDRPLGRGFVRALAVEPSWLDFAEPRRALDFGAAFWRQVLRAPPGFAGRGGWRLPRAMVPPEGRVEHLRVPLLCYLVAFVLIAGPLNLIVLGRLRRREWLIVTAPATALVFLGVAVILGAVLHGHTSTLSCCTISVGSANLPGQAQVRCAGVGSPGTSEHALLLPGDDATPVEFAQDPSLQALGGPPTWLPREDGRLEVQLRVPQWSMRAVSDVTYLPEGTLRGELLVDQEGLHGTLRNDLPVDLQRCYLIAKWNHVAVGDVLRGASRAVRLPLGPPRLSDYLLSRMPRLDGIEAWLDRRLWDGQADTSRWELPAELSGGVAGALEGPLLVGWGPPRGAGPEFAEPGGPPFGEHLYVFRLPVRARGPRVAVPLGACRMAVGEAYSSFSRPPREAGWEPEPDYDPDERGYTYEFLLPTGQTYLRHRRLAVAGYLLAEPPRGRERGTYLSLWDFRKGAWVRVSEALERSFHQEVPAPERFVQMPQGLVRARLGAREQGRYFTTLCATWIDLAYEGEVSAR